MSPAVSVVMPAYNAARFIAEAIASVRAQTFRDHELVIVDDGSTDDTAERAAAAAPDAVLVRSTNGGPGRARNLGVERARGERIAFLDADDVWFPDALSALEGYARRHPDAGLVGARFAWPWDVAAARSPEEPPRDRFCDVFHQVHTVHTGAVLIPRRVLLEVGGFDERRELYVEDWDLWIRIAARHPIGYVPRPVVWHRPGGIMSSAAARTYIGQQLTVEKTLPICHEACPRFRADPERCARGRRHLTHQTHARELLRAGRRFDARCVLRAALDEEPLSWRTRLMHAASYLPDRALARIYGARDLLQAPRRKLTRV
jgi:Glycosyl transferase family 2